MTHKLFPDGVSNRCAWCDEVVETLHHLQPPIIDGDTGQLKAVHIECRLRMFIGSVGHQQQQCECHGIRDTSEDGMTMREAAIAAYNFYREKQNAEQQD